MIGECDFEARSKELSGSKSVHIINKSTNDQRFILFSEFYVSTTCLKLNVLITSVTTADHFKICPFSKHIVSETCTCS